MNLRELSLQKVLTTRGVVEVGGENIGPEVNIFLHAANLRPGNPWCAALQNWGAEQAAAELKVISPLESVPLQGFVQSYVDYGRAHDWIISPDKVLPGMLAAIWHPHEGRYAHLTMVQTMEFAHRRFFTIEGNSNDDHSREGKKVCELWRPVVDGEVSNGVLFLHWTKVVKAAA